MMLRGQGGYDEGWVIERGKKAQLVLPICIGTFAFVTTVIVSGVALAWFSSKQGTHAQVLEFIQRSDLSE